MSETNRTRFDLEQDIMNCWSVVEDVKELSRCMLDRRKMTEERLFETFEMLIRKNAFNDREVNTYD
jgi:hypothetical protein